MSGQALPFARGARVIHLDSGDFRALTVTAGSPRYVVAIDPETGGECAAPADCFLAVPDHWADPPPTAVSDQHAVESSFDGPIPAETQAAAAACDEARPALSRRLDAAEAWLAWVATHLCPLSPNLFEGRLRAARSARETALRRWLAAAESPIAAIAAE
jgi:hypothetical protein